MLLSTDGKIRAFISSGIGCEYHIKLTPFDNFTSVLLILKENLGYYNLLFTWDFFYMCHRFVVGLFFFFFKYRNLIKCNAYF